MKALWDWLDGNKTIIGTLILAVLSTGILPDNTFAYDFFQWLGSGLAAGGLIHKALKGRANTGKQQY